jgi:hypothetical protein
LTIIYDMDGKLQNHDERRGDMKNPQELKRMKISKFVNEINLSFPDFDGLIKKLGPDIDYLTFKGEHTLVYDEDNDLEITSFSDLIQYTNIGHVSIGSFLFYSEIRQTPDSIEEFGIFNNFYLFGTDVNKEIICHSNCFDDMEVFCSNVNLFLNLLIVYNSYDKKVIFSNESNLRIYDKEIDFF